MSTIPVYGVYRIKLFSPNGNTKTKLVQQPADRPGASLAVDQADATLPDQWIVYPVSAAEGVIYTFRIKSNASDCRYLSCASNYHLKLEELSDTTWNVELVTTKDKGTKLRVSTDDNWGAFIKVDDQGQPKFEQLGELTPGNPPQYSGWEFERVDGVEPPEEQVWSAAKAPLGGTFEKKFFGYTLQEAAREKYDIIIIGSGIGGGILANDLYDTNFRHGRGSKRVLLLERGGVVFHSHCLNTARPAGLMNDRGQQNDTFFNQFKEEYDIKAPSTTEDGTGTPLKATEWSGGPMYNLGGRSAAWGLFSPRVHDTVLEKHFHRDVVKALQNEYYDKAERLMLVSLPTTRRVHQHIMDRLTLKCREEEKSTDPWHWGRIASEFKDDQNFDFAEGAYSTIDKILEFSMSRPTVKHANKEIPIEHKYFKTVLNAEVRSLEFNEKKLGSFVTGVKVQKPGGKPGDTVTIKLRDPGEGKGAVILCAGSVNSPAILLRSPLDGIDATLRSEEMNGLHLTDHTVVFYQCSFRYSDPAKRSEYGAMKLQTYTTLSKCKALVNMSIDASSFLPRGKSPDPNLAKFIIVYMLQECLVKENTIKLNNRTQNPEITMGLNEKPEEMPMKKFTLAAMKALVGSAGVEFVGFEGLKDDSKGADFLKKIELGYLPLGGVAHELGTLPMQPKSSDEGYCLRSDLSVRPEICKGVYVCDLSVFPHSPEANPTLTLAALSIRLSRHLHPRLNVKEKIDSATVYAVNHSGAKVKVFLSKHQSGQKQQAAEDEVLLEPGQWCKWERQVGVPQALLVYQLDRSKGAKSEFLAKALILEAHPGRVTTILST
ncbi:unnamed protein product [Rhizoctonia solani]|uniref:Glucose-methanol-choline oxidoreductase C-terminal domain-containing protein n=1 Tax=Rhizoctonia solani TaxID=456999 RepID=A0A8H3HSB8_9AGAM|nr:unnamed protein product [Rhizoctonia solani]